MKKETIEKIVYIVLTILFCLAFLGLKLFTMGWLTIMIVATFILPVYLILYLVSGIQIACIKQKTKFDYIRYWGLSFFFLLSALTFCDFGDVGPTAKIIQGVSDNVLLSICAVSAGICTVLAIASLIMCMFKKD